MSKDHYCHACGLKGMWREGWTHEDHRDYCPRCGPGGRSNPPPGKPCHWMYQTEEDARRIREAGGRPAALLADSYKGSKAHILLIACGWEVRFSQYLEAGKAYIIDAKMAFPTDAELKESIREFMLAASFVGGVQP